MLKKKIRIFVLVVPAIIVMIGILAHTAFYLTKPGKVCTPELNACAEIGCANLPEQNKAYPPDKPLKLEIIKKAKSIQMPFVANEGQMDEQVRFYAKTFCGTVFVTKKGEIVYSLPMNSCESGIENTEKQGEGSGNDVRNSETESRNQKLNLKSQGAGIVLKEEIVGAQFKTVQGEQPFVTKVNYFEGNDPSQWKTNIPTYNEVNLGEVYEGIGLRLRAYGNNVEKLFCVKPGATPDQISLNIHGAKSIKVNEEGLLAVDTEHGTVSFTKPIAYQEIDGKRVYVAAEYVILERDSFSHKNVSTDNEHEPWTYRFAVASYDKTRELVVDPLLVSTFLGGSSDEVGYSIATDSSGNVYIAGLTHSSNFPTTSGAYDTSNNGGDVFVSKLNGDLTAVLASTFLGGTSFDSPRVVGAMVIDSIGNVYVAGLTESSNFPTTSGAYDTSYNFRDVFVSKLSNNLTDLIASTFLGGSAYEEFGAITLDLDGNLYVSGRTSSSDFPTTEGAYDTSYNGSGDAFISKLNGDLTNLLASSYLGGSSDDVCYSIAIKSDGNLYMGGFTHSSDFPITVGAYDSSFNSVSSDYPDIFISKMNGDLTSILSSTYLGGSLSDMGILYLGSNGNVYVVGTTSSLDFPTTPGTYDTSYNGGPSDIFITSINEDLTSMITSTYFGGSSADAFYAIGAIASDSESNIYVFGSTSSTDLPISTEAFDTSFNGGNDSFVSKFNSNLTNLLASTYLGGSKQDHAYGITTDSDGDVYVVGGTYSLDFPTTSGAYDTTFNGGSNEAFVAKFDNDLSASPTAIELTSFTASTDDNGTVRLTWETATEVDTAGFNIYRAKGKDGDYKKINEDLIGAKGSAVAGAAYNFMDSPGRGTLYYKLEDMDYSGAVTMHGPTKVRVKL